MAAFEVARGTRDILPAEMAARNHVEGAIRATFESYGYQQIQTPVFEDFELFAARSGQEIRESMFTLVFDHREYALRPELTAPVCRLIASGKLEELPLPYKLYYIGQCYRYGRPEPGRYREFTQAGLELMGCRGPMADAEVIAVAARALENLGVAGGRLKIGNIGIVRRILDELHGGDLETQGRVIEDLDEVVRTAGCCQAIRGRDRLTDDDVEYVRAEAERLGGFLEDLGAVRPASRDEALSPQEARGLLAALPAAAEASCRATWAAAGTVPPETGELLMRIARLRGPAETIIPQARELLSGTPGVECVDELGRICELLGAYGLSDFDVVPGLARGLGFYTGSIFEIDCPEPGAREQVCGGGRYDRLVEEFGGPSLPATGFAFSFERIVELRRQRDSGRPRASVDVFVAAAQEDCRMPAVEAAQTLRAAGLRAAVDLMGLDLERQLAHAARLHAGFAVVLGAEGLDRSQCSLRALPDGPEQTIAIAAVADEIARRIGR